MADPLDQIDKLLATLRNRSAELNTLDAVSASLATIGQALRDAVMLLERPKPDGAATIGSAIAAIKFPEPTVKVNVQPAPVTVQPMPRDSGAQWRVVMKSNAPGVPDREMLITKL
ncbi:MAG: hypothetical protein RLZZ373_2672 [Pseudomonadota bacterium]|jgi:hypothetical protein